jgi:murein DD-endopeptidase MepM/ murein hydrolase activator NlpD
MILSREMGTQNLLRVLFIRSFQALALSGLLLLPLRAETRTTPVQTKLKCGMNAELRLSSPASNQGGLLLAELRSEKPLREPKGKWDGKEILFWNLKAPEKARLFVFKALLGVDLEQPAGKYGFAVSAETQSGETVTCTANVLVRAGHFAIENLQVAKQFVEPDPEQLKRGHEEQQRLRVIFASVTPERLWQGSFRIPLDGVASGKNFGKRRILNGQAGSPHGGVDLPGVTGTPVYAAQSGRIVLAEELFFSGNTVVVDHGLGIYTFYGHLSEISVKIGDEVGPGALLGKVGATGRVTGPHLHWGLTVCRARVDPLQIVKLLPSE